MKIEGNLNKAIEDLPKEDKKELDFLHKELSKAENRNENNVMIVEDKKLKKKIAKFCLKLVDKTGDHEKLIQETSHIIAGFIQYEFGDDLDEITSIAGELELPKHHVSGNVFEMFEDMKKLLKKYLS